MRSQWCREHIDETARECGLDEETVSRVKKVAKFCASQSQFCDCGTAPIYRLISIPDDLVREKAISSASKALESGKHPVTGAFIKDKRLTDRDVKKIIDTAEREVRGELAKQYREEKKSQGSSSNGEHPEPPPVTANDKILKEKFKERKKILAPVIEKQKAVAKAETPVTSSQTDDHEPTVKVTEFVAKYSYSRYFDKLFLSPEEKVKFTDVFCHKCLTKKQLDALQRIVQERKLDSNLDAIVALIEQNKDQMEEGR